MTTAYNMFLGSESHKSHTDIMILDMTLNDGDNQNKKSLGIKDVLCYESYPSCIAALSFLFIYSHHYCESYAKS